MWGWVGGVTPSILHFWPTCSFLQSSYFPSPCCGFYLAFLSPWWKKLIKKSEGLGKKLCLDRQSEISCNMVLLTPAPWFWVPLARLWLPPWRRLAPLPFLILLLLLRLSDLHCLAEFVNFSRHYSFLLLFHIVQPLLSQISKELRRMHFHHTSLRC